MEKENPKIYSYDEAYNASVEYFNGDTLAATVFLNKYALKDEAGNLYEKTPDDMHWRLANEFARIESKYANPLSADEIYSYLKNFEYISEAGSPMAGIGNPYQSYSTLANCYVVPSPYDSFGGIISDTSFTLSEIFKRRGGAGCDLSTLRPKGAITRNSSRTSSGLASFMELFSTVTKSVGQNSRRGALMLSVAVRHPDSLDFINSKTDLSKVTSANISVRVDDEFMKAVDEDGDYELRWPIDSDNPTYTKTVKARDIWKHIVHNAWASAEPGVLFWDTIIKQGVSDEYGKKYENLITKSTNPCAELPLPYFGSCRLNTLNLFGFVKNPYTENAYFDFELLKKATRIAQRMLDDLVDMDIEKVEQILNKIKNIDEDPEDLKMKPIDIWEKVKKQGTMERRTGLGITALGDALAALGYKYGTKEATDFAVEIQKVIAVNTYKTSVELAKERGAFPIFEYELEKDNPFMNRLYDIEPSLKEDMQKYGRRNVSCLTIAPTGSVSLMTQTSSGVEPVFMPVYKRRRKVNPNDPDVHVDFVDPVTGESFEEYIVFHPKFKMWMEVNGIDTTKKFSQKEVDELVAKSPYAGATANDIDWKEKVNMQGKIQKYVDHSISVTINLPESISEETVNELYLTAWKAGCKGLTVYRENSRSGVLVSADSKKKKESSEPKIIEDRPVSLAADIIRFKNNKENWIAFVGKLPDGSPYEIFTGLLDDEDGLFDIPKSITSGKIIKRINEDGTKSYDFEFENKRGKMIVEGLNAKFNPEFWNYSKLLSSVLRYKMPINHVLHLVESLDIKEDSINSWKAGVKRALKRYIKDGDKVVGGEKCPECGSDLIFQDGCVLCPNCGYSKCG